MALQEAAPTTGGGTLWSGGREGEREREKQREKERGLIYANVFIYICNLKTVLFAFPCSGHQARMLLMNIDSCSVRHESDPRAQYGALDYEDINTKNTQKLN